MKKYIINFIILLLYISKANSIDLTITHGVINTTIGYANLSYVNVGGSVDTTFNFYNNESVDVLNSCGTFPPINSEFIILSQTCGSWIGTQIPNPSSINLAVNSSSSCSVTIRYTPISNYRSDGNFQLFCQDSDYNGNTNPHFNIGLIGANNAPVITGFPTSSIAEDSVYSFISTVDDVDMGDSRSFTISNQPSWATFDNSTGLLTGTPINSDVGVYSNIIITVSDAAGASDSLTDFSITVNNTNDAPIISGLPAGSMNEDSLYTFTPTITDVDIGDDHTFIISNKPNWATFDLSSGLLSGIPTNSDVGIHSNIIITVTDTAGSVDSLASFSITVNNTNDAPIISNSPAASINEDLLYTFMPTITDVDVGDSHSFTISNEPSWVAFNGSTGLLIGTPVNSDVGVYSNIIITVIDAAGASNITSFSITVNNTNDAPAISGSPATSINEDANYVFIPIVSDVDIGDSHTFVISNKPSWATLDPSSGLLSGTPTNSDVGFHPSIIITVTDTAGSADSLASFSITVNNTNDSPIISGSPAASIYEDLLYTFMPTITDADVGDSHSFSINNQPNWATFDNSTGLLTGTPVNSDVGVYSNIIITVSDAAGASDSLTDFSITVNNTNDAPIISGLPAGSMNEDSLYTFTPTITDVDIGDDHTFIISNKPNWATFDFSSGLLSGIPTNSDVGIHSNIIITVTDTAGSVDSLASFSITVNNTNDAPVISNSPAVSVVEGISYNFMAVATDVDVGDSHTFSISNLPSWATFNSSSGLLSGIPFEADVGIHSNIIITVTDAAGANYSLASFSITVIKANDAAVINAEPQLLLINDKQEVMPFVSVLLSDDGGTISLNVSFDESNGILVGNGLDSSFGGGSISLQAVASAQAILQSLRFIPTENQVAAGSAIDTVFSIAVSDGLLESIVNSSIQVSAVSINDAPTVYGQSIRVVEGSITNIKFIAEDLEHDGISFSQLTAPVHGDLTINGDIGEYISNQGHYGFDSFSIVANDGIDNSLPLLIDLKIVLSSDEGMAVNDTIVLPINYATNIYELDVLANDNQTKNPQIVSILSLSGDTHIESNKVLLHLDNIQQPYFTFTYVTQDSEGRYAKAQVNLIFSN
jgi:hypothetical protein